MSSDDYIDAGNRLSQLPVVGEAEMGKEHDDPGAFVPDLFYEAGQHFFRIEKGKAADIVHFCAKGGFRRGQSDNSHLQTLPLDDRIRSDTRQVLTFFVNDIGRNNREGGLPDDIGQYVPPPIELMVPERHGIEMEHIHHIDHGPAVKKVRNGCSLEHVPGREENSPLRVSGPFPVDHLCEIGRASAWRGRIDDLFQVRKNPPVKIVHMKNGQLLGRHGTQGDNMSEHDPEKDNYADSSHLHSFQIR
ncbi:MAG: hypothetical protein A4E57_04865 [Syntrophorhabdaceae bacterium PtaU1.Bin034]|nr:MAG: hypothetical protein A4E57_04865 [Syntrophorhabdaceae bacterium PtaU1.Bin034]